MAAASPTAALLQETLVDDSPSSEQEPIAEGSTPYASTQEGEDDADVFRVSAFSGNKIREMADIIEEFRANGLQQHVALPKVVVAGNQSAGKSSLLENLVEIPFPVGQNICTRFATEVNLRPAERFSVTADIRKEDGDDRSHEENNTFPKTYHKFGADEFRQLVLDVTEYLNIPELGATRDRRRVSGFAPDKQVLVLNVRGPGKPCLSFVDTPGICESSSKNQSADDISRTKSLVLKMMSAERTIIVAVMAATNDSDTQGVFELAGRADSGRSRTLGVLTKCDRVSLRETDTAVRLAKNEDLRLNHGWFLVRNRTTEEVDTDTPLAEVREEERQLFEEPRWQSVGSDRTRISNLQSHLCKSFAKQVQEEFPKLQEEMQDILEKARIRLDEWGPPRNSTDAQRNYLQGISDGFLAKIGDFKSGERVSGSSSDTRSWILFNHHRHEKAFIQAMKQSGSKRSWKQKYRHDTNEFEGILAWIHWAYDRFSEPEFPGLISPKLVKMLFREQTEPWMDKARAFVETATATLKETLLYTIGLCCRDGRVVRKLGAYFTHAIEECAQKALSDINERLESEYERMFSADDAFATALFAARAKRLIGKLKTLQPQYGLQTFNELLTALEPMPLDGQGHAQQHIPQPLKQIIRQPDDNIYDAYDMLQTYYDLAVYTFWDNVIAICQRLISSDGPLYAFNKDWIRHRIDTELESIAGEDQETIEERGKLIRAIEKLETALAKSEDIEPIPPRRRALSQQRLNDRSQNTDMPVIQGTSSLAPVNGVANIQPLPARAENSTTPINRTINVGNATPQTIESNSTTQANISSLPNKHTRSPPPQDRRPPSRRNPSNQRPPSSSFNNANIATVPLQGSQVVPPQGSQVVSPQGSQAALPPQGPQLFPGNYGTSHAPGAFSNEEDLAQNENIGAQGFAAPPGSSVANNPFTQPSTRGVPASGYDEEL